MDAEGLGMLFDHPRWREAARFSAGHLGSRHLTMRWADSMRGRAVSAARTGGIEPRPSDSEFYQRNLAEYEGRSEVDERLLTDFIDCTTRLEAAVAVVDPPAKNYRAAINSFVAPQRLCRNDGRAHRACLRCHRRVAPIVDQDVTFRNSHATPVCPAWGEGRIGPDADRRESLA
jgi:hypothetical protein